MKNWLADMNSSDRVSVICVIAIAIVLVTGTICLTVENCIASIHGERVQQGVRGEQVQGGIRQGASPTTN